MAYVLLQITSLKWVDAKFIYRKNAENVARNSRKSFLYNTCRHGCTVININDQDREFCNKISENLFNLTETSQCSAYHQQANGLVE